MGKKRKGQHQQHQNQNSKKKAKHRKPFHSNRCWIETCKSNKAPKKEDEGTMTLTITRIELYDDHNPKSKNSAEEKGNDQKCSATHAKKDTDVSKNADEKEVNDQNNGTISASSHEAVSCSSEKDQDRVVGKDSYSGDPESKEGDGHLSNNIHGPSQVHTVEGKKEGRHIDLADGRCHQEPNKNTDFDKTPVETEKTPITRFINVPGMSDAYVHIKLAPSAQQPRKAFKQKNNKNGGKFVHLPNGDCGDGVINPMPNEVEDKYWAQRKRLFQKFDDGIQLDKEGWFSVTPEVIAAHITKRSIEMISKESTSHLDEQPIPVEKNSDGGAVVLDAFCGCGGNAISFANSCETGISLVVCIDIDRTKLRMATHNASIYGVDPSRIIFIQADAIAVLKDYYNDGKMSPTSSISEDIEVESCNGYRIGGYKQLPSKIDLVFLSPPWGGIDYMEVGKKGFNIRDIQIPRSIKSEEGTLDGNDHVIDGEELLCLSSNAAACKRVIYFLPRNLNGISFGRSALAAGYQSPIEVEQNIVNSKLKTVTAYLQEN